MKKLLIIIFLGSFTYSPLFADSRESVNMGETVTIEHKMFQPLINARVLGGEAVTAPLNIYSKRPLTQFIGVDIEITNVGKRSDEIEFDDFSIFINNGGLSSRIGWPVQIIVEMGGQTMIYDRKYEPVLEPGAKVNVRVIFGLTNPISKGMPLILAFDDDGYPRSSLELRSYPQNAPVQAQPQQQYAPAPQQPQR